MTEIGGVADAITEPVDQEAVRAKLVMREIDRVAYEAADRREGVNIEWSYERHQIGRDGGEGLDLVGVTIDRDVQVVKCRDPSGRKVVAVEVVRQRAAISVTRTPVPSRRFASVRGPMPASISRMPAGDRRIAAFPAEPLARTQSSRAMG